jgi:hypothetical protein
MSNKCQNDLSPWKICQKSVKRFVTPKIVSKTCQIRLSKTCQPTCVKMSKIVNTQGHNAGCSDGCTESMCCRRRNPNVARPLRYQSWWHARLPCILVACLVLPVCPCTREGWIWELQVRLLWRPAGRQIFLGIHLSHPHVHVAPYIFAYASASFTSGAPIASAYVDMHIPARLRGIRC